MKALLRRRSPDEIRERLAQKLTAIAERVGAVRLSEPDVAALNRKLQPAERQAYEGGHGWGRGLLRGKFFPSFDDLAATVAAATRIDPQYRQWAERHASRAASGSFDLLGHRNVQWPLPVDWHLEPQHEIRVPRVHWSRIDYLNPQVVGDHKLLWELNRLQWLIPVAQLARMSGDARWSRQCIETLDDWMNANPPGIGVNWSSSLEVSYRAIAWLWVLHYIAEELTDPFSARIAGFLWHAGRHIERYLSTYFSPNTHLTGEALGLLYIGTQLPQFAAAKRWRELGWTILCDQVATHIRPDGTYFEQATWYHRYTVDIYLHALILAERNGLAVPTELRERLELALRHLMSITRPDGSMPLIGDDDGGKLVQLDDRTAHYTQSVLALGAVCFAQQDLAFVARTAKGPGSELAWLLGSEGAHRFDSVAAASVPPQERSTGFVRGGVFVLRDGWGPSASVGVVDCGPHGVMNCGHAHADVLAIDLSVGGHPILVDPGTASYTIPEHRNGFRSSAAHNTVTLDGRSSSVVAGPFNWQTVAVARLEAWVTSASADFLRGSHDGYRGLVSPAIHRRSILYVRGHYWLIVDEVEAKGGHNLDAVFQGAVGSTISDSEVGMLRYCLDNKRVMSLQSVSSDRSVRPLISARLVSGTYGSLAQAPAVVVSGRFEGNQRIVTVLSGPEGTPAVTVTDDSPGQVQLELSGSFGTDLIRLGAQEPWSREDVAGDVEVAWIRRASDRAMTASLAAGRGRLVVARASVQVLPLMSGEVRG